jgi:hypothetical protein
MEDNIRMKLREIGWEGEPTFKVCSSVLSLYCLNRVSLVNMSYHLEVVFKINPGRMCYEYVTLYPY